MSSNSIVFFDFDGTITKSDSFFKFILFAVGWRVMLFKTLLLSPVLFLYKIKLLNNSKSKEIVFSTFFKGWEQNAFTRVAEDFSLNIIPNIIRKKAEDKIRWHIDNSHKILIVSASIEDWIAPWAKSKGIGVISTKAEVINGKLSGKFKTKNCYGKEKKNRIEEIFNLEDYEHIYAYGDSGGDKEMLALANKAYYREFE